MVLKVALSVVAALMVGSLINWISNAMGQRIEAERAAEQQGDTVPSPRPLRNPAVRLVAVYVLSVVLAIYIVLSEPILFQAIVLYFYFSSFILIAVIDIEHHLIVNEVMLPVFAIALLETLINTRIDFSQGLMGYAVGQIIVMIFYLLGAVYLWIVNMGRDENPVNEIPFGFGDVTLATYCGLVVGFPAIIPMLVLMILIGAMVAFLYILVSLVLKNFRAHTALPYGPSIVMAATVMLLWGDAVAAMMGMTL